MENMQLTAVTTTSCSIACMSGYNQTSGDATYTCPTSGGTAITDLVCTEIQCSAIQCCHRGTDTRHILEFSLFERDCSQCSLDTCLLSYVRCLRWISFSIGYVHVSSIWTICPQVSFLGALNCTSTGVCKFRWTRCSCTTTSSPPLYEASLRQLVVRGWTRRFTLTNKESVSSVTVKTSSEDSDALYDDISVSLTSVSPSTIGKSSCRFPMSCLLFSDRQVLLSIEKRIPVRS